MDPERRANMIASAAAGQTVQCPKCGSFVPAGKKFCTTCGFNLAGAAQAPAASTNGGNVFSSVDPAASAAPKPPITAPVSSSTGAAFGNSPFTVAEQPQEPEQPEPRSALAEGLPSWTIVPPHEFVKRRK